MIINRTHNAMARSASIRLPSPDNATNGTWQRMDLVQKDQDVGTVDGIKLGGGAIDPQGNWSGHWQPLSANGTAPASVIVSAAAATLVKFTENP